jgi:GDP-L-fucose synthase
MALPTLFPLGGRRIFVAGHRGMVGSALIRRLAQEECRFLTVGRDAVDLRDRTALDHWFDEHRPEAVLLPAARARGIHANGTHPGDFLYDNLAIATKVIEASQRTGVAKLPFPGSSCILSASRDATDDGKLPTDRPARVTPNRQRSGLARAAEEAIS